MLVYFEIVNNLEQLYTLSKVYSKMSEAVLIFFGLLTVFVSCLYLYVSHIYSYWKRKNICYLKPVFPVGNFGKNILQKLSIGELTQEFHNSYNEPVIGFYAALRPSLLIRDPEIIRNILIKDFSSFYHRGLYSDESVDPLTGNLLFLNGEKWRKLRSNLSPAFTTGKLKAMVSTLVKCGDSLQKHVAQLADTQQTIEVRDTFARYSTNVIANVAFGIDNIDCIRNPDSEFRRYGKKIFEMTIDKGIRAAITFLSPNLMSLFRIRATDKSVQDFMTGVVKENLEFREKNRIVRRDFFQLLMQLRNTGTIAQNDDEWKTEIDRTKQNSGRAARKIMKCLTLDEMTAQSFIFFTAGFETTSTTQSFCLYELAKAPEIQSKVHTEIDSVLEKHNGQLTYDSLSEMKYLENCIDGK